VVQLAAHRAEANLDIAKTLTISQLSESHRQILVAAREASVMRVTPIAQDTLLKLVRGQVLHELGEDRSTDMHPSLSETAPGLEGGQLGRFQARKIQIDKIKIVRSLLI